MSSEGSWSLEPTRLAETLARWREHDPSVVEQDLVDEFLMDLTIDPFGRGREDGDTGNWIGWAGPFILVLYVPDRQTRVIAVADINYG